MQPYYVILLLKCFLTQFLSGAYREGDSWSGFCFFNIISYCSPPHCFLSQAFLSLKPQSSFLPIDIYICCFFYLECISPAFHMEGSSHLWYQFTCHHFREAFSDLRFVGYYSHSIRNCNCFEDFVKCQARQKCDYVSPPLPTEDTFQDAQ